MNDREFWNLAEEQMLDALAPMVLDAYEGLVGYQLRYIAHHDVFAHLQRDGVRSGVVDYSIDYLKGISRACRYLDEDDVRSVVEGAFALPGATRAQQRKLDESRFNVVRVLRDACRGFFGHGSLTEAIARHRLARCAAGDCALKVLKSEDTTGPRPYYFDSESVDAQEGAA